MKFTKLLLASLLIFAFVPQAQAIIEFDASAKIWFVDSDLDNDSNEGWYSDKVDYGASTGGVLEANFKHIVPFVPNVGLRYTHVADDTRDVDLKFNHLDVTAFYSLLDITPFSADLGFGAKWGQFEHQASGADENYDDIVPYVFGRGKIDIVGTGLAVKGDVRFVDMPFSSDTLLFDTDLGVSWKLCDFLATGELTAGYRYFVYKQDTGVADGAKTTIKGPYVGIGFDF